MPGHVCKAGNRTPRIIIIKVVKSEEAQSSKASRAKVQGPEGRGEGGVFGRGQLAPLPTSYKVWESAVSSPSEVRSS